jgi:hypothetical protein
MQSTITQADKVKGSVTTLAPSTLANVTTVNGESVATSVCSIQFQTVVHACRVGISRCDSLWMYCLRTRSWTIEGLGLLTIRYPTITGSTIRTIWTTITTLISSPVLEDSHS